MARVRRIVGCAVALAVVSTGTTQHRVEAAPVDPGRRAEGRQPPGFGDIPDVVELAQGDPALKVDAATEPVAPGVRYTNFDLVDDDGFVSGDLLTVTLSEQVSAGLLAPESVAATAPLSEQVAAADAVAGVNGDFFDIDVSGAALGPMLKDGTVVKSGTAGDEQSFGVTTDSVARLAEVFVEGTASLPGGDRRLDGINQPRLPADAIGLYTPQWGTYTREAVLSGDENALEVPVSSEAVAGPPAAPGDEAIPTDGYVLVGRGNGADALRDLTVGDAVSVSYAPRTVPSGDLDFSVGGGDVIVRDGTPVDLPDDEFNTTLAPRTAVGISADGRSLLLITIDGRQAHSRGVTPPELAELMVAMGADDALNLDGGGSSTMLARTAGDQPRVTNSPSDGQERPTPNGIGLFTRPGSGTLSGLVVEPTVEPAAIDAGEPIPVLGGLHRRFVARGHDETLAPVAVDPDWSVRPSRAASVDNDGLVRGRSSGSATIIAECESDADADGDATCGDGDGRFDGHDDVIGSVAVRVYGSLNELVASPPSLGLSGDPQPTTLRLVGVDADGNDAIVDPVDLELDYDDQVVDVADDGQGGLSITPNVSSGATLLTASVGRHSVAVPITVGYDDVPIDGFPDIDGWTFDAARASGSLSAAPGVSGGGLALDYDFTESTGTRAAYAIAEPMAELPRQPQRIGVEVLGDGNGAWLRAVIRDATDTQYTIDVADSVTWTDWQHVEAEVPDGVMYPIRFERIYPVETDPARQYRGRLVFDDLVAQVAPHVDQPDNPTVDDPIIVTDGDTTDAPWRFAVMSDAQFVADEPDSRIVAQTRRVLREIVAADPEFLVINGDLVDTGYREDFEFANQLLDDEIGDAFPVYWVPGNHELLGPGTIDNFVDLVGPNHRSFVHEGTRFVLLDSSSGTYRADFEQIIALRALLDDAANDDRVSNVVVMAHHPSRDPSPAQNSQLADPYEADFVEDTLASFEARSGKPALMINSHAGLFHADRTDGVPRVIVGNAAKTPAVPAELGGYNGWALVGVDAGHRRDPYAVEVRPTVDDVALDMPSTLPVGDTADVEATATNAGRTVELVYPVSVDWTSESGDRLIIAPSAGRHHRRPVAVFDPATRTISARRPGEVTLRLTVNGVTVEQTMRVVQHASG